MSDLTPSNLKTVLHSKRANIYYIEHCRVLVKGGRVEYVTEEGRKTSYWNIPIANTTVVLLGTGTSITQAAVRELSKAGVMIGFCGGGGSPLLSGTECNTDIAWMQPQSEYRPTEYLQSWVSFWFDNQERLRAAKILQHKRIQQIRAKWLENRRLTDQGFAVATDDLEMALETASGAIEQATDTTVLLTSEANLTKRLFSLAADAVGYGLFRRAKQGSGTDPANSFLDHGNYLAYGLAATATWVLGLPHGLAVLHGKTRRGGLVFDVADIIKDAVILPQAFVSAMRGDEENSYRQACISVLLQEQCLDVMIDTVKELAHTVGDAQ